MYKNILIGHGAGGKLTRDLIHQVMLKYFKNDIVTSLTDSAILENKGFKIAFTTDSYVVHPVFFPGGDIGKLSVCGTVNDLAVAGAIPKYLSCSFIIEEGFALDDLEKIVASMANEANDAGVQIVTGDTKVVEKGKCDKIFINTTGLGVVDARYASISYGKFIQEGDKLIVNGTLGDHTIAILGARKNLSFTSDIQSDCCCLHKMIAKVLETGANIRFMRDITRGGLATILNEIYSDVTLSTEVWEDQIPMRVEVKGACESFGFDPLYLANEGKVLIIVDAAHADKVIQVMHNDQYGKSCRIIGEVKKNMGVASVMKTSIGGTRIIDMINADQLPRIC